jgi:hypothetical protein
MKAEGDSLARDSGQGSESCRAGVMELVTCLPSVELLSLSSSEPESAQVRAERPWKVRWQWTVAWNPEEGNLVSPPTYVTSTYLTVLLLFLHFCFLSFVS